jgi:penicillin-binding protein 2
LAAFGDRNGALVAIDPRNGGVLAMVSKPGFDPNLFVEGISVKAYGQLQKDADKPLYNRALRGQYPPGSTVKPFIGLGGLETGTVGFREVHFCGGYYQLPDQEHKYRDWKKAGHGPMDMDSAITQSCDVYFYELAHDMGIDKLSPFLEQFGFGKPTGIDLSGELPGLLPSRAWKRARKNQPWYPGETLIMGIGQGYFLTTPLQLAAATAAFANGQDFLEPRVVAEVVDKASGAPEVVLTANHPLTIVNAKNWQNITTSMLHVVEGLRGTARSIRSKAYRIAGKTGTAQVFSVAQEEEYDEEKIAEKLRDHALFIAYAPAEAPKIAVAVVVENGGHGGSAAAPIARRIMDIYLEEQD